MISTPRLFTMLAFTFSLYGASQVGAQTFVPSLRSRAIRVAALQQVVGEIRWNPASQGTLLVIVPQGTRSGFNADGQEARAKLR